MKKKKMSRREFIAYTATAATAFTIGPRFVLGGSGYVAPSDKLNIACIGVGGKGASDVSNVESENIIALCDVDYKQGAITIKRYPKARKYKDFRIMLEKEYENIDAVMVSTPDHTHAVAAMAAIKMDKHVYCQKPLAHDMYEVRSLTEEARKRGLITQMGIQIHAIDELKFGVEIIKGFENIRPDFFSFYMKFWGLNGFWVIMPFIETYLFLSLLRNPDYDVKETLDTYFRGK